MSRTKRSRKKSKNRRYSRRGGDYILGSRQGTDQKISAVLLDFIGPYKQVADTDEAMERLVALGITAWNVSMLPEQERDEAITKVAGAILNGESPVRRLMSKIRTAILGESRDVADFKRLVNDLVERKLQCYAGNRRFILDYELSQSEDNINLFVVSTLTPVP